MNSPDYWLVVDDHFTMHVFYSEEDAKASIRIMERNNEINGYVANYDVIPLYKRPTPSPYERPTIRAEFETTDGDMVGRTSAPIKRVELEDDDSYTVVIDYWPK